MKRSARVAFSDFNTQPHTQDIVVTDDEEKDEEEKDEEDNILSMLAYWMDESHWRWYIKHYLDAWTVFAIRRISRVFYRIVEACYPDRPPPPTTVLPYFSLTADWWWWFVTVPFHAKTFFRDWDIAIGCDDVHRLETLWHWFAYHTKDHRCTQALHIYEEAIRHDANRVIEWALERRYPVSKLHCTSAIYADRLDLLQLFQRHQPGLLGSKNDTEILYQLAYIRNCYHICLWLYDHCNSLDRSYYFRALQGLQHQQLMS